MAKCCHVNVSKQIQTKKPLKDQYIVYSIVTKDNLVLKYIALITNS